MLHVGKIVGVTVYAEPLTAQVADPKGQGLDTAPVARLGLFVACAVKQATLCPNFGVRILTSGPDLKLPGGGGGLLFGRPNQVLSDGPWY